MSTGTTGGELRCSSTNPESRESASRRAARPSWIQELSRWLPKSPAKNKVRVDLPAPYGPTKVQARSVDSGLCSRSWHSARIMLGDGLSGGRLSRSSRSARLVALRWTAVSWDTSARARSDGCLECLVVFTDIVPPNSLHWIHLIEVYVS